MTLFRLMVAHDVNLKQKIFVVLFQLGAPTKPFFLCQICHTDETGHKPKKESVTFFLVQMLDPTQPIQTTVSLANGLKSYASRAKSYNDVITLVDALKRRAGDGDDWARIAGVALSLEMSELEYILCANTHQPKTQ